jgi:hypothetical protein
MQTGITLRRRYLKQSGNFLGGEMLKKFISGLVVTLFLGLFSVSASAYTFNLVYEFDGVLPVQSYGTVDVTQNNGDLDFVVTADTSTLGSNADINVLYFNLIDGFTGLNILTSNASTTEYEFIGPDPSVRGGAGADFDWGVDFGSGGGSKGNGILHLATFTLSADQDLQISHLFEFSDPNNTPSVNLAVHFQNTDTPYDSETVGAAVPIPAAAWLLGTGLIGLIGLRRRFQH